MGAEVHRAAVRRRLLIVTRDVALLRGHYEDVIAALCHAGVRVQVRYVSERGLSAERFAELLRGRDCEIALSRLPTAKRDAGDRLGLRLRQVANLLRFSHPDYRERSRLSERKFARALPGPRRWAERLTRAGLARPALTLAAAIDRVLPPADVANAVIAETRPDAVVAVPVIRTPEFVDYLKAASRERIPTASWVQSWDNLSTKGLLHFTPDRVFVWNATQRDELLRYHGIPERNVCVTGAQTFDHWFADEPVADRAEFCARHGLDPERPIVLYLASSRQLEPPPTDFFARWLRALRTSERTELREASVVARPHPTDVDPWLELELGDSALAVSPCTSAAPINSAEFRQRYREELRHASIAVALNTSGMIDAAIFGKPVCTIELPEFSFGQRGTVHFEYLSTGSGGLLRTATTFAEHVRELAALIDRDPYARDERSDRFVREFVRPRGLEVSPASVFADEMLRLLRGRTEVPAPGGAAALAGRLIHRAAPVVGLPLEERQLLRRWSNRQRKTVRRQSTAVRKRWKRLRKDWKRRQKRRAAR